MGQKQDRRVKRMCSDPTDDVYFLGYLVRRFLEKRVEFEIDTEVVIGGYGRSEEDTKVSKPDVVYACEREVGVVEITVGASGRVRGRKIRQIKRMCGIRLEDIDWVNQKQKRSGYLRYVFACSSDSMLRRMKKVRDDGEICHVDMWHFRVDDEWISVDYETPVCFADEMDRVKKASVYHFLIPVFGGKDEDGFFYRTVADRIRYLLVSGSDITPDTVCREVYGDLWDRLGLDKQEEALSKVRKLLRRISGRGEELGLWELNDGVIKSKVRGSLNIHKWRKLRSEICEEHIEMSYLQPLFDEE